MKLNKFVQFPLILAIVGSICAGALGVVYEVTKKPISDARLNKSFKAVKEIVPDMSDKSEIITKNFDDSLLKDYSIKTVYDIKKGEGENAYTYAYGYQAEIKGQNDGLNFVVVFSASENKVLGLNIVSHKETPGLGDKALENPDFLNQFIGASFDDIAGLPKQDFIVGATNSPTKVKEGVDKLISFHRFEVMHEVDDGIKLSGGERKLLDLQEGLTLVNKTDLFLEKLGKKANEAVKKMGLLNYIQVVDSSNNVVNHAYIVEGEANCEVAHGQREIKAYRFVLMFDANWENSKLIVVYTEDTISSSETHNQQYPNNGNLINHPWLETFAGYTMTELVTSYNKHINASDAIVGATGSTKGLINHVPQILKYHALSKIQEVA